VLLAVTVVGSARLGVRPACGAAWGRAVAWRGHAAGSWGVVVVRLCVLPGADARTTDCAVSRGCW